MDKKQKLEELENKYEELRNSIITLKGEVIDFQESAEYEKYQSYTEDIVKQTMYPREYAIYKQIEEVENKLDPFFNEIMNAAKDVVKERNEDIARLESKLNADKQFVEKKEAEIKELTEKIEALKQTEEYKNGDEATILQTQEMEADLKTKFELKEKIASKIKGIEQDLKVAKEEKQNLIDEYGEEIDEQATLDATHETEQSDANGKPEEENKKDKDEKKKQDKQTDTVVTGGPEEQSTEEISEEEKAKIEQEEKDKKLKEDFTDLSTKAKKGTLTDQELDSLVDIMKDKDNYEKLGMSMGLFFNKPRGIFKALNKKYKDNDEKLASINEAYSVYEEKFYEKHGEEKLKKLSKFFSIDEVEHKEATRALPADLEVEEAKKSLGDELGSKTVADGEYVDISSSSKTKTEPAKEEI